MAEWEFEWNLATVIVSGATVLTGLIAPLIIRCMCRPVYGKAAPGNLPEAAASLSTPLTLLLEELLFIFLLFVAPLPEATEDLFRPVAWFLVAMTVLWLTNSIIVMIARAFSTPAILMDSKSGESAPDDVSPILSRVLRALVLGLFAALALEAVGLSVTPLVTGLGIGGLVVGLALQATLANMMASASIMSDRPFEIGDYVEIGGKLGAVESIGLRSTRIRTLGGMLIVVPNSVLDSQIVENQFRSRFTRWVWSVRVLLKDTAQVRSFLQEARGLVAQFPGMASDADPYSAVYVKEIDGVVAEVEFKLVLECGPLTDAAKCNDLSKVFREQIEEQWGPPKFKKSRSFSHLVATATAATEALGEKSSSEQHRVENAGGGNVVVPNGVSVKVSSSASRAIKVRGSWAFWPVYLQFRELFSLRVADLLKKHELEAVSGFRMQKVVQ